VEAVLASTQNLQRKIDLCRSENLHSLHFNCHVERSRDISCINSERRHRIRLE
jgi:hypothetical protein